MCTHFELANHWYLDTHLTVKVKVGVRSRAQHWTQSGDKSERVVSSLSTERERDWDRKKEQERRIGLQPNRGRMRCPQKNTEHEHASIIEITLSKKIESAFCFCLCRLCTATAQYTVCRKLVHFCTRSCLESLASRANDNWSDWNGNQCDC